MNRKSKTKNKTKSKKSSINKGVIIKDTTYTPSSNINPTINSKPFYLDLPVDHIKSDLLGIILFAIFAFVVILLLNRYNITLDLVLSYMTTSFSAF